MEFGVSLWFYTCGCFFFIPYRTLQDHRVHEVEVVPESDPEVGQKAEVVQQNDRREDPEVVAKVNHLVVQQAVISLSPDLVPGRKHLISHRKDLNHVIRTMMKRETANIIINLLLSLTGNGMGGGSLLFRGVTILWNPCVSVTSVVYKIVRQTIQSDCNPNF